MASRVVEIDYELRWGQIFQQDFLTSAGFLQQNMGKPTPSAGAAPWTSNPPLQTVGLLLQTVHTT